MKLSRYNVVGFEEYVPVRMTSEQKKAILKVVRKNKSDYPDVSLFVRASVNKMLRDFDKSGKRKV